MLIFFGKPCHPGSLCRGGNSFPSSIGEGSWAISSDLSESTGIKNRRHTPSSSGVLHAVLEVGAVKVPYEHIFLFLFRDGCCIRRVTALPVLGLFDSFRLLVLSGRTSVLRLDLIIVLVAPVSIAPLINRPAMITLATTDDFSTRSSEDSGRSGVPARASLVTGVIYSWGFAQGCPGFKGDV
uniref:Uncharacterized protein n=1 Tax=Glossina pallidipes TaxID=7398 RepID=A0A1A9ZXL4_GLOPL